MHGPSADALIRAGATPTKLHNNCSGKHAGMLATCKHLSWPLESYLQDDHPLQRANRAALAAFAGMAPEEIPVAVDGCGVPTFYLGLTKTALAWARLTSPEPPAPYTRPPPGGWSRPSKPIP